MITHVAIKRGDKVFSLPSPNRHHHILHSGMMDGTEEDDEVQGFLDDAGKFLTRAEAYVVAKETGQLDRSKHPPGHYDGTLLFSEDLW